MQEKKLTGYPSIDMPWLKYHAFLNDVCPVGQMMLPSAMMSLR